MTIIDYPDVIERTNRALHDLDEAATARFETALARAYEALLREVRDRWEKWQSEPTLSQHARSLRINEVRAALTLLNSGTAAALDRQFQEVLEEAIRVGQNLAAELINAATPIGFSPLQESFGTAAIEAAANQAQEGIKRLRNHSETFRNNASILISQGLLQGISVAKIEQQLTDQFGVLKSRAATIARTEVLSANNRASEQSYLRNGVHLVILYVTDDDRLCPVCAARAGNVYKIETILVPLHPNCRCFLAPYLPSTASERELNWLAEYRERTRAQPDYLDEGASAFEKANKVAQPVPVAIATLQSLRGLYLP